MRRLHETKRRVSHMGMTESRPSLKSLAGRGLLAGLVAGSIAAIGFTNMAGAQNLAGFNSNQPVNFDADRIELQDRQDRVVLAGNVVISQGDLRMSAQRTTVAFSDEGSLSVDRIDASGNVVVRRGNERASGAAAVYDFNRKVIVLSGGVTLQRGSDTLNGGRIVMDLNTGVSSLDGNSAGNVNDNGRVSGSFTVPES